MKERQPINMLAGSIVAALVLTSISDTACGQLEEGVTQCQFEFEGRQVVARISPDRLKAVWIHQRATRCEIFVSDTHGKNRQSVTSVTGISGQPVWNSEGSQILFLSGEKGLRQVRAVNLDGTNLKQLTQSEYGCRNLLGSSAGHAVWQQFYPRDGKSHPSDVVVLADNKLSRRVVRRDVGDMAWNQSGDVLAIGMHEGLWFADVHTDENVCVKFVEEDERLFAHGAHSIKWSPDGDHVSCRINFLGGREIVIGSSEESNRIFGDREVFLISRTGDFSFFDDLAAARKQHDWIK